jgi:hypothetical protein
MEIQEITVTLTPEIRIGQALIDANIKNIALISKLTIIGTLIRDDFRYISKNMGKTLQELDMGDATLENNTIRKKTFFKPCNLTSITIPDSTGDIYLSAFHDCPCLTSIIVRPGNLFWASEDGLLYNKEKTELVLCPQGREGDCYIPNSVIIIDTHTFYSCNELSSITVSPDNSVFASEDGVLFNKNKSKLFFYPRGRQGDYVIPCSVVEIWDAAFFYCRGLTSITIPDSIVKINTQTFQSCDNLTSISIPKSIVELILGCYGCDFLGLVEFKVHPDNPKYASENGVLFNKSKTRLLYYPKKRQGDYIVPDTVIKVESNAFKYCTIKSVTIPKSVVIIGDDAFEYSEASIIVHPDNPFYKSENGKLIEKF